MSELDFEAEFTAYESRESSTIAEKISENVLYSFSEESTLDSLDTCSSKKASNLDEDSKSEVNPISKSSLVCNNNNNEESGNDVKDESKSDDKKYSGKDPSDLEEGEISDSNTDDSNKIICKYIQAGKCVYGSKCRFIHPGVSAYKMFDPSPSKNTIPLVSNCLNPLSLNLQHRSLCKAAVQIPPPYHLQYINNVPDDWEKGLEVAKQLILRAKDMKENDLEFEEKKLYLSIEEDNVQKAKIMDPRKTNYGNRSKKHCRSPVLKTKTDLKSKDKPSRKLKKRKIEPPKSVQSSQSWIDPWRRSRSRTRNISRSDSSLSSQSSTFYRESHSSMCSCSSENELYKSPKLRSKSRSPKRKSKLDRVFARTLGESPNRRRRLSCSDSSNRSLSLKRSPPRYAKTKRSSPNLFSRSLSSSCSKRSKKFRDKKSVPKSPISLKAKSKYNEIQSIKQLTKKRDSESFDRKSNYSWNSASETSYSDVTISSFSCSSLSDFNKNSASKDRSLKNYNVATVKFSLKKSDKLLHHSQVLSKSSSSDSIINKSFKDHYTQKSSEICDKPAKKFSVKSENSNSKAEKNKSAQKQVKVKQKIFSADEKQLLRFANVDEISNKIKKNAVKTKKPKDNSLKTDTINVVSSDKTVTATPQIKKESRKEMLIKKLKEVEEAIAKKKNLTL